MFEWFVCLLRPRRGPEIFRLPIGEQYRRLVEALRYLSSDAEVQMQQVPLTDIAAEEMAEAWEYCRFFGSDVIESDMLPGQAVSLLERIKKKISEISDRKETEVWSDHALSTSADWQELRTLSASALAALNEKVGPPDLYWIKDA